MTSLQECCPRRWFATATLTEIAHRLVLLREFCQGPGRSVIDEYGSTGSASRPDPSYFSGSAPPLISPWQASGVVPEEASVWEQATVPTGNEPARPELTRSVLAHSSG